jgi:hypothetical protein
MATVLVVGAGSFGSTAALEPVELPVRGRPLRQPRVVRLQRLTEPGGASPR